MSETQQRPMGFWSVWALTAGCMIGSGIFLLPTVLAPYGLFALAGWLVTGLGAVCIALVLGRLAVRSKRSGGTAVFVKDALGAFPGFIAGWSLWISLVISVPAISMAFAGYAGGLLPVLASSIYIQILTALGLVCVLTSIALKGVEETAAVTVVLTVLKLVPLLLVCVLALWSQSSTNLPDFRVPGARALNALAETALLTMWAFVGVESGVVSTDSVRNPEKNVPRGVIAGVLTATLVYIAVTVSTLALVPTSELVQSEAPLIDATATLGKSGSVLVGLGAMVATGGSLLAVLFVLGFLAFGMAREGIAPNFIAVLNKNGAPQNALLLGASLGALLLSLSASDGLVDAFKFLLMMSTATSLLPYLLCAIAELKQSRRSAFGWVLLSAVAACYSLFALIGSGAEVLLWGLVMLVLGVPIYLSGPRTENR
ncbi:MAG: amino acid permease [Pseudomonadota bacterium]